MVIRTAGGVLPGVVPLGVLLLSASLLAAPGPAYAADATVTVVGNSFGPGKVRVGLGDSVTWEFEDTTAHTSTSDQGFWDSGTQRAGDVYTITAGAAGTFGYHCEFHGHMRGTVTVPLRAAGSRQDGWTLTWASAEAADGRDHDVQVRRKGTGEWKWFRRDVTAASGAFHPSRAGTWQVRARVSNTEDPDDVRSSGWSPVRAVKVA